MTLTPQLIITVSVVLFIALIVFIRILKGDNLISMVLGHPIITSFFLGFLCKALAYYYYLPGIRLLGTFLIFSYAIYHVWVVLEGLLSAVFYKYCRDLTENEVVRLNYYRDSMRNGYRLINEERLDHAHLKRLHNAKIGIRYIAFSITFVLTVLFFVYVVRF